MKTHDFCCLYNFAEWRAGIIARNQGFPGPIPHGCSRAVDHSSLIKLNYLADLSLLFLLHQTGCHIHQICASSK